MTGDMEPGECEVTGSSIQQPAPPQRESLFERSAWFYALCREYLFRDHTSEIAQALFASGQPGPGLHVVEIGCGPGFYACRLAQRFPQIRATGVDLSRPLLARARSRAASRHLANCSFQRGDAHALGYETGSVDGVVVSRLFLIVPEREEVLGEIHRILRPGGRCFVAEPTSGFRTRIPLSCMWMLSKLTSSPAGKYCEPRQADVMSPAEFGRLVQTQPWAEAAIHYDGWYQYAVCTKVRAAAGTGSGMCSQAAALTLAEGLK